MTAENLLSRLERVRKTGTGRWVARCPAHDDRGPSLSVRELDDGRVLLHCFAGCDVQSVLGALGVGFEALHPPGPLGERPRERRAFSAADALRCVAFEAALAATAASSLARGAKLSDQDRVRLWTAAGRIATAMTATTWR